MSRKRKIEAVATHVASAALDDVVSRSIAAVIGRLEEPPDVDGEVERLDTLVTMVRSAVEAAEGVHIRNASLRRWLWKLRDAGCEGAAAVRSFRRRAAEEGSRRHGVQVPWWVRLARSAKSLFFPRDDATAATELRREVRRLELLADGIGDFLKLLDKEAISLASPALGLAYPVMPEDPDDEDCGHWGPPFSWDYCESSGSSLVPQPDLAGSDEHVHWDDVPSPDSVSDSDSDSSAAGIGSVSEELDRCISGLMVCFESAITMVRLALEVGSQLLRLLDDCGTAGQSGGGLLSRSTSMSSDSS